MRLKLVERAAKKIMAALEGDERVLILNWKESNHNDLKGTPFFAHQF